MFSLYPTVSSQTLTWLGPKLTKQIPLGQSRIDLGTLLNHPKTDLMDSVLHPYVDMRLWGIVYGWSLTRVCALGIEEGNFRSGRATQFPKTTVGTGETGTRTPHPWGHWY